MNSTHRIVSRVITASRTSAFPGSWGVAVTTGTIACPEIWGGHSEAAFPAIDFSEVQRLAAAAISPIAMPVRGTLQLRAASLVRGRRRGPTVKRN
jgi:hypothetical protein